MFNGSLFNRDGYIGRRLVLIMFLMKYNKEIEKEDDKMFDKINFEILALF